MIRSCNKCIFNQKKKEKNPPPKKSFPKKLFHFRLLQEFILSFTISTSLQTHDMVDILNFNHFTNNLKVVFSVDLFVFLWSLMMLRISLCAYLPPMYPLW